MFADPRAMVLKTFFKSHYWMRFSVNCSAYHVPYNRARQRDPGKAVCDQVNRHKDSCDGKDVGDRKTKNHWQDESHNGGPNGYSDAFNLKEMC